MKKTHLMGLVLGALAVGIFLYLSYDHSLPSTGHQKNKDVRQSTELDDRDSSSTWSNKISQDGPGSFKEFLRTQEEVPSHAPKQIEKRRSNNSSKVVGMKAKARPFNTLKSAHTSYLRQSEVIEQEDYVSESGQSIRATLVKASDTLGSHFIIKDTLDADKNVSSSYSYVANHVLVRFKDQPVDSDLKEFEKKYSIAVAKKLLLPRTYLFEYGDISLEKDRNLLKDLPQDPSVEYSSGNAITYSSLVPNDTLYQALWGLNNNGTDPVQNNVFVADTDIQADDAWENMTDCSNSIVAVLDTGIDPNHPDLKDNVLAGQGRDYTSADINDFEDRQAHGTHVAGTIGAVGNNGVGITGVCWKAQIIPVKVLGDNGTGTLEMVVNGLTYASQTQAKLLNLSLGGAPPTQIEADAIAANTSQGKLLIIAAGNENNDNDVNPAYPASYPDPGIVSVAAIHGGGDLAVFSNFGATTVDIAAPGQDIVSTIPTGLAQDPNNAYAALSGTSMAAPHVAGAVALFWSYAPELTAQEVKAELLGSSITGTFSKNIDSSRSMDLNAFMDAVKSKATIQEVADTIAPERGMEFTLNLSTEVKYAEIEKIEIIHLDEVIGQSNGDVSSVTIEVPLGFAEAEIFARVTDAAGRVYESSSIPLDIDLNKGLSFQDVDALALSGSSTCQVVKTTADGDEVLYESQVANKRRCQKFCDVVGPLLYSSKGEIKCSQGGEIIYSSQQSGGE